MSSMTIKITIDDMKEKTKCENLLKLIMKTEPIVTADEKLEFYTLTPLYLREVYRKNISYEEENREYTNTVTLNYCDETAELYVSSLLMTKGKDEKIISTRHIIYCGNSVLKF